MDELAELEALENVGVRRFLGKRAEDAACIDRLTPESQAGLRQFSLERMMGYGIDYADAVELRARVIDGQEWQPAASALADEAIGQIRRGASPLTAAALHRRASALLRMSQALMTEDSDVRRDIVQRASDHFVLATAGTATRRILIDGGGAPLAGWFIEANAGEAVGTAIVIGGIEGWAMDFECMGLAMAARGVSTLMLDGPGQGESRILHRHFLTFEWLEAFRRAVSFVSDAVPGRPVGIVGNSMGGSIALAAANNDERIAACCNNGGIIKPSYGRMAGATFFAKMMAFCGTGDEDEAAAVWDRILPVEAGVNRDYALLVVQGGRDPLVSVEHGKMLMDQVPVERKRMEIFSDGDHCIYNHRNDRDMLIADWMRDQLSAATDPSDRKE
jgi:esterase/lipase